MKYSPQLATPRRALFSTNLFGTLNGRGKIVGTQKSAYAKAINRVDPYSSTSIFLSWIQ